MSKKPTRRFRLKGRRLGLLQWIEGRGARGPFVVSVMAEAVIPDADPSEPCFEPDTLRWLDEVQRLADAGDTKALSKLGEVYVRKSA